MAGEPIEVVVALGNLECADCGDPSRKHFGMVGPCAGCWERMETICERFRLRDGDRKQAGRLLVSAGADPLSVAEPGGG